MNFKNDAANGRRNSFDGNMAPAIEGKRRFQNPAISNSTRTLTCAGSIGFGRPFTWLHSP